MSGRILIDQDLFIQMVACLEMGKPYEGTDTQARVRAKLDAMERHSLYSAARNGNEQARNRYLDEKGVPDSFRR